MHGRACLERRLIVAVVPIEQGRPTRGSAQPLWLCISRHIDGIDQILLVVAHLVQQPNLSKMYLVKWRSTKVAQVVFNATLSDTERLCEQKREHLTLAIGQPLIETRKRGAATRDSVTQQNAQLTKAQSWMAAPTPQETVVDHQMDVRGPAKKSRHAC